MHRLYSVYTFPHEKTINWLHSIPGKFFRQGSGSGFLDSPGTVLTCGLYCPSFVTAFGRATFPGGEGFEASVFSTVVENIGENRRIFRL